MPTTRLFLPLALSAGLVAGAMRVEGDLLVDGTVGVGTGSPRSQIEATGQVHLASAHRSEQAAGVLVGRMNVPYTDRWSRLVSFSESADFLAPGSGLYGLWGTVENASPGARFATATISPRVGARRQPSPSDKSVDTSSRLPSWVR